MEFEPCAACGREMYPKHYDSDGKYGVAEKGRDLVFYECPVCGPAAQGGPEDANMPPGFPAPALSC